MFPELRVFGKDIVIPNNVLGLLLQTVKAEKLASKPGHLALDGRLKKDF